MPIPSQRWSASRRAVKTESSRSASGASSKRKWTEDRRDRPRCTVLWGRPADRRSSHGKKIDLAEEAGGAMPDDLSSVAVEDCSLTLDDRDERVAQITNPEEHVTDCGGALLTDVRKRRELRGRQDRSRRRSRHRGSVPPLDVRLRGLRDRTNSVPGTSAVTPRRAESGAAAAGARHRYGEVTSSPQGRVPALRERPECTPHRRRTRLIRTCRAEPRPVPGTVTRG